MVIVTVRRILTIMMYDSSPKHLTDPGLQNPSYWEQWDVADRLHELFAFIAVFWLSSVLLKLFVDM